MYFDPRTPYLHISALAPFSGDGRIYRAFDHLIVATHGAVLLAPIHLVQGPLTDVVDGCPVPWDEVIAMLSAPMDAALEFGPPGAAVYGEAVRRMARIAEGGWEVEPVRLQPGGAAVWVFRHGCGVRYAVPDDLIFDEAESPDNPSREWG